MADDNVNDIEEMIAAGLERFDGESGVIENKPETRDAAKAGAMDTENANKAEADKAAAEKVEADLLAKAATDDAAQASRAAAEKAAADKAAADKAEAEKASAEKAAADKAEVDKALSEKASADKAEADKAVETDDARFSAYENFVADRHQKFLEEIEAIDPDDDDYIKKVSRATARRDRDVRKYEIGKSSGTDPQAGRTPQAGRLLYQEQPTKEMSDKWAVIAKTAKEEGIDPENPYFMAACKESPAVDSSGSPIPFDDQVKWAVSRAKVVYQALHPKDTSAAAESRQLFELPLGPGGGRSDGNRNDSGKKAPVTLDDALSFVADENRIH